MACMHNGEQIKGAVMQVIPNPSSAPDVAQVQSSGKKPSWLMRKLFGAAGFTFRDIIDTLNPLQHIPFIGSKLREARGADMGALPRLAGGFLLGGGAGLAASATALAVKGAAGHTPDQIAMKLILPGQTPQLMADVEPDAVRRGFVGSPGAMRAYAAAGRLMDRGLIG